MKYLRVIMIVLLLVCCTLWVTSYRYIRWLSSDRITTLLLFKGNFIFVRFEFGSNVATEFNNMTILKYIALSSNWRPVLRVDTYPGYWALQGTFWLPTMLLALPLVISASPWARRRRRAKQGLCTRCGYDLSGTDHTLCPECGKEVRKANPA